VGQRREASGSSVVSVRMVGVERGAAVVAGGGPEEAS
jgi:hypothetical protein